MGGKFVLGQWTKPFPTVLLGKEKVEGVKQEGVNSGEEPKSASLKIRETGGFPRKFQEKDGKGGRLFQFARPRQKRKELREKRRARKKCN